MMFSRLSITTLALLASSLVNAQTCSNTDSGACDFDPFNPVSCGTNYACGYSSWCLARENGYDPEADCCQAPQPSSCTAQSDPQLCGSKKCPYANLCIAELAGYTADQCESPPPECATSSVDCSGEPSNPQKCGPAKECPYENMCEAKGAGYVESDCCQDIRSPGACTAENAPVSCGPPGGKQCPYTTQCVANSAGYNDKQCCAAVPDGTAVTSEFAPVLCGSIPCYYSNQGQATAAGYPATECCPQGNGACTADNNPVRCNDQCNYSSQSCADVAGFTPAQCCAQPRELSSCPSNYAPVACSSANCVYDNDCIAQLAGFDPNSCVAMSSTGAEPLSSTPEVTTTGDETTTTPAATSAPSGAASFMSMGLLGVFALLV